MTTNESAPDPTAGDGRLDAHIAAAEHPTPDCRDCEVGEPHMCPATPPADDASEPNGYRVSLDLTTGALGVSPAHIGDASEPLTEAEREALWSGLRRARHEDAPVPLVHEHHKIHVLWAVTPAVERIVAAREAAAATKARAEGAAQVRDDIQARRREFKRLGADEQYVSALDDAFGLAANRARGDA